VTFFLRKKKVTKEKALKGIRGDSSGESKLSPLLINSAPFKIPHTPSAPEG